MRKFLFYLLSFTWGLPMALIGCVVAAVLFLAGYRPKRWGHCWYFEVGKGWGGVELGVFFITNERPSKRIRNHEFGHALQNCVYGWLMPFLVCIPSAVRYWWREYQKRVKKADNLHEYDSIWFEGQATRWGTKYINEMGKGEGE